MTLDLAENPAERLGDLRRWLRQFSAPATDALVRPAPDGSIRCLACGHRCVVKPGRDGVCRVRFNEGGTLRVPWGYVAGAACDPIEKKPFFHVLPGSDCLTFGMLGCDYHCGYCQNWVTSQMLRETMNRIMFRRNLPISWRRGRAAGLKFPERVGAASISDQGLARDWGVAADRNIFQRVNIQDVGVKTADARMYHIARDRPI